MDAADHGASISVNFDLNLHFGVPGICLDDEKNMKWSQWIVDLKSSFALNLIEIILGFEAV